MLPVLILMVGKTRMSFVEEGLALYRRRLGPYLEVTLKSVRQEKEGKHLSPELVKAREGERLRRALPPRSHVVALDVRGRLCTSEEFARWLAKREEEGLPLVFVVGGHLGLDEATLAAARETLALSRLTLTHELARLVLLEQLYRAKTILAGHPYHV
uniref:Ribosomal RNA large subunit methyltransferase H n=1 Tax=Desulfobacca acetoxidans TaxID=60893 RepID=A0A7V4G808_9BACT